MTYFGFSTLVIFETFLLLIRYILLVLFVSSISCDFADLLHTLGFHTVIYCVACIMTRMCLALGTFVKAVQVHVMCVCVCVCVYVCVYVCVCVCVVFQQRS